MSPWFSTNWIAWALIGKAKDSGHRKNLNQVQICRTGKDAPRSGRGNWCRERVCIAVGAPYNRVSCASSQTKFQVGGWYSWIDSGLRECGRVSIWDRGSVLPLGTGAAVAEGQRASWVGRRQFVWTNDGEPGRQPFSAESSRDSRP